MLFIPPPVAGHPENGGSEDVRNLSVLPYHFMASQLRRTRLGSLQQ